MFTEQSSKTEVTISVPFIVVVFEYTFITFDVGTSPMGFGIVQFIVGLGTPVAEHTILIVVLDSPYTLSGE